MSRRRGPCRATTEIRARLNAALLSRRVIPAPRVIRRWAAGRARRGARRPGRCRSRGARRLAHLRADGDGRFPHRPRLCLGRYRRSARTAELLELLTARAGLRQLSRGPLHSHLGAYKSLRGSDPQARFISRAMLSGAERFRAAPPTRAASRISRVATPGRWSHVFAAKDAMPSRPSRRRIAIVQACLYLSTAPNRTPPQSHTAAWASGARRVLSAPGGNLNSPTRRERHWYGTGYAYDHYAKDVFRIADTARGDEGPGVLSPPTRVRGACAERLNLGQRHSVRLIVKPHRDLPVSVDPDSYWQSSDLLVPHGLIGS